jgi:membrane protease subunit HflC
LAEGERIRAEGYKQAQVIKGQADAKTSQIYAQSFGKDPQFAEFFRSLDAYKNSFKDKNDILVIDPSSNEFFKSMRSPGQGGR